MDTPGARVYLPWQLVGVGALELAQAAVLHQYLRQRVALFGQLVEHRLRRGWLAFGGLAQHRHAQLVVENRAQLLGRAEVELLTGQLIGALLQLGHLHPQLTALHLQQRSIDQRPLALDLGQHRHQRHLDVHQYRLHARRLRQAHLQRLVQTQGDVRVFGSVGAGLVQVDLVEGQLLGAFAGNVLESDGGVVEVLLRQAVHVVTGGGGVQHVRLEHGVVGNAAHFDGGRAVGKDVDIVLGVLPDLGLGRVFQ